jgi:hypothetical protein
MGNLVNLSLKSSQPGGSNSRYCNQVNFVRNFPLQFYVFTNLRDYPTLLGRILENPPLRIPVGYSSPLLLRLFCSAPFGLCLGPGLVGLGWVVECRRDGGTLRHGGAPTIREVSLRSRRDCLRSSLLEVGRSGEGERRIMASQLHVGRSGDGVWIATSRSGIRHIIGGKWLKGLAV